MSGANCFGPGLHGTVPGIKLKDIREGLSKVAPSTFIGTGNPLKKRNHSCRVVCRQGTL